MKLSERSFDWFRWNIRFTQQHWYATTKQNKGKRPDRIFHK